MGKRSRTRNASLNVICAFISAALKIVLAFFVQQQLVKYLGYDLVGVNKTCTTIISTLSVVDMGFGSIITFCLYEPLASENHEKLALLIRLFRKFYTILACIIIVVVAATMPFIKQFTQSSYDLQYLCVVYALYAGSTVISYLFYYNQTILIADQKEYISTIVTTCATSLLYIIQFIILYSIKYHTEYAKEFFLLYLAVAIVMYFISNVILYIIVKKKYPYLRGYKHHKLAKEDRSLIKIKMKSVVYHRVGNYLISGTDTLIISGMLSSVVAGITSNYYTITTSLTTLLSKLPAALLPGFGNLMTETKGDKVYKVYRRAQLPLFALFAVAGVGATVLSDLFIGRIWLDSSGLMDTPFVVLLGTTFFMSGYASLMTNVRYAAGVFEPDKYVQIVVVVINLVISILLVKVWGAAGVLVGTFISLLIKESTVLPYVCCKYIFQVPLKKVLLQQWLEYLLYAILVVACWYICNSFVMESAIIEFILKGMICVIIPCVVIGVLYCRTDAMRYYISMIARKIKRISKSDNKK